MRFRSALVLFLLLLPATAITAQMPQVTEETQVPSPGSGHDYIQWLNETVNPSNGSVNVDINVPMPQSRQTSIPFSLAYNSGQAIAGASFYFSPAYTSAISSGGWGYTVPMVTYISGEYTDPDWGLCMYTTDYVFADATGKSTTMEIGSADSSTACLNNGYYTYGINKHEGVLGDVGPPPDEWAPDGTVYRFSTDVTSTHCCTGGAGAWMASQIEDRNGNLINISSYGNGAFTYTDTMGRPVLSSSGFGSGTTTVTSSKFGSPFTVTWGTASYNYMVDFTVDPDGSYNCTTYPSQNAVGSMSVISSIELPNGQSYIFTYDPSYGRLSKITYPSGAYVRYVWGMRPDLNEWMQPGQNGYGYGNYICRTFYAEPVITDRYVSADGSTETEHQHFDYTPYYPSFTAQTTVTDTDLTIGQTVHTVVYNYTPANDPVVPFEQNTYGSPVFLESSVVYSQTGSPALRTVNKGWVDIDHLGSQITTLEDGSAASETFWCYDGNLQLVEKDEFGYSGTGAPGTICSSSSTGVGPLLRKTVTTYNESFGQFDGTTLTGQWIVDRPSSVALYDGSNVRMAETDYNYGNTTSPVTVISGTHDDTNYAPSSTLNRANLLSATKQCWPNCQNATTTFTYDDTGQVLTQVDPDEHPATQYFYNDCFTSGTGSPSGATDGYLTEIIDAAGHAKNFCHGYNDGTLRTSTDENSQTTSYAYNDSMDRLTSANYPDGGSTTYGYEDVAPMSTTITQAITTGINKVDTATYDGFGREIQTELSSDPLGPVYTATQYDGIGRKYRVWNPTRCVPITTNCGESTWGYTTYSYDPLDRVTEIMNPDNSTVLTTYVLSASQVQDEGNGSNRVTRISQTDALSRLLSVCEVTSAAQQGANGTPSNCGQLIGGTGVLTTYTYDALDDLLSATQAGLAARSFQYDSLSRLTNATNPENGQITYGYDPNGNVTSRIAPEPNQTNPAVTVTVTNVYDALNHLTGTTYSDGTRSTAYTYDNCSVPGISFTNIVGRLCYESTAGASPTASVFSYDPMGRVKDNSQCTVQNCGSSLFPVGYNYDKIGDITYSSDGMGVTFTDTYDGAAHLTTLTSSLADSNHPGTLFSNGAYNSFGSLASASIGTSATESWGYTDRDMPQTMAVTGAVASPGTPGAGSATIGGSEQSIGGSPATAGSGSVTFSGTLQSTQVQTQPATAGTGSVTISGAEKDRGFFNKTCRCIIYTYDSGGVSVAVNGVVMSGGYGENDTPDTVAANLANIINGTSNSPVTASVSGSVITLTAKATGASTNYSLSTSSVSNEGFSPPSFAGTPSGSTLTGGSDAVYSTIYDSGISTITVNGHNDSASWSGSGTTASSIAGGLTSAINGDSGAPVTASASGSTVYLTAKTTGASTNYSLSSSSTYDSGHFSGPSFTSSNSGSTLTGGADAVGTTYDSGNVWITVNGTQYSASYGQGSTSTAVASALANSINTGGAVVTASASGSSITLTATTNGSNTNYSLSVGSSTNVPGSFPQPSFSATASGGTLAGGTDPGTQPGTVYSYNLGYAPNGDVLSASDTANGNWTYTYDDFNRLSAAVNTAQSWTYTNSYDRYGNRWDQYLNSGCTAGTAFCITFDANNHVNNGSLAYDAAGNVIRDSAHFYYYDAENRLIQADGTLGNCAAATACYVYDAQGRRVQKTTWGVTVSLVYDLASHQVAEVNASGGFNRGEVYAGGKHVATYVNGTTYFNHADWLGTERARTGTNGVACEVILSLPFGDGETTSGNCGDPSPAHFTGKEHDNETGLENFLARYDSSSLGRFMSPDWARQPQTVPYAEFGDPQSLNLYSYVRNSPVSLTDPTGHCWDWAHTFCNEAQRVNNLFHGEGFHTNQQVDEYHKAQAYFRELGVSTRGFGYGALIKTYQTYTKQNLKTGQVYSGRTSGYGTPEQNVRARDAQGYPNKDYGPAQLDKSSENPAPIRGREQQLIRSNGGAQSESGTSGNAINGVSPNNPKADYYDKAAQAEFDHTLNPRLPEPDVPAGDLPLDDDIIP